MNSKQLQYAIMLSETLNFSQLAEHLKISQPALSKQILALEQELGVKLFDRSTTPMRMTPAGEYFIRESKALLFREDQLIRSMEDFKDGLRGRLDIGISPFRSLYLIPGIIKKVRDRYPGIQITLHETGSDQIRKEAAEGKYDFAIVNLPVDESVLDVIPIEPDRLVLCVPTSMLPDIPRDETHNPPAVDIRDCGDLPFIAVGHSQEMRRLFEKICASADFTPNIAMEVVGVTTAWAMVRAGIGATLLPLQFVKDMEPSGNISFLTLKGNVPSRQPVVVTRHGQYLSAYAQYAIRLLAGGDI